VLGSLAAFPGLVTRRELTLHSERLGQEYRLCDGCRYRVFRDTRRPLRDERRAVIEVGFRLRAIRASRAAHWLFQRVCTLTTPFWSGFDGFAVKLWMVDPRTRSYAGIYEWGGAAAAQRYLDVLIPVLRCVSVPGSVFARVHADTELQRFLAGRGAPATDAPPSPVADAV
jgi:hypothetical protein